MPVQIEVSKEEMDARKLLGEARALVRKPNATEGDVLEMRERVQDLNTSKLPKKYTRDRDKTLDELNKKLFELEEGKGGTSAVGGVSTFKIGDLTPQPSEMKTKKTDWAYGPDVKAVPPPPGVIAVLGKDYANTVWKNVPMYFNGKGNIGNDLSARLGGQTMSQQAEFFFGTSSGNAQTDSANVNAIMNYLKNNQIDAAISYANSHGLNKGGLITLLEKAKERLQQKYTVPSGTVMNFSIQTRIFELGEEQLRKYFNPLREVYLGGGWTPRLTTTKVSTIQYANENGRLVEKASTPATKTQMDSIYKIFGGLGFQAGVVPIGLELVSTVDSKGVARLEGGSVVLGKPSSPLISTGDEMKLNYIKFRTSDMRGTGKLEIPRGVNEYGTSLQLVYSPNSNASFLLMPSFEMITSKGVARLGGGAQLGLELRFPKSGIAPEFATLTIYGGLQGNPGIKSGDTNIPWNTTVPIGVSLANTVFVQYDTPLNIKRAPGTLTIGLDLTQLVRYAASKQKGE